MGALCNKGGSTKQPAALSQPSVSQSGAADEKKEDNNKAAAAAATQVTKQEDGQAESKVEEKYIPKKGDKIIWQFWHDMKSDNVPKVFFDFMGAVNDDWHQVIITNDTVFDYLEKDVELPKGFNDCTWKYVAQKADMIRTAVIYKYGGIYCDATILPLDSFDNLWNIMNEDPLLTYFGCRNRVIEKMHPDGYEFSVFWFAGKSGSPILKQWVELQQKTFFDCLDTNTNHVTNKHPMYLDFGDQCLKSILPPIINGDNDDLKKEFALTHIIGCWQTEEEMGEFDWKLYNDIVDILLDKSLKLRHAHYFRESKFKKLNYNDYPLFIKLHRGGTVKPEKLKESLKQLAIRLPTIDDRIKTIMNNM